MVKINSGILAVALASNAVAQAAGKTGTSSASSKATATPAQADQKSSIQSVAASPAAADGAATFTQPSSSTDAALQGNCLSQRIDFSDKLRFFDLANSPIPIKDLSSQIDTSRYDMTIDYGNVTFSSNGASLLIKSNPASPQANPTGTRISTTRFMKYGKITAVAVPGVVNSFISAGPPLSDPATASVPKSKFAKETGDEIDIELLGKDPKRGTNNVFFRGLLEFSKHDQYYDVPNGIAALNKYSIEWKHETITFSLNDVVLRTYRKSEPEADSEFVPGVRFFPDRPQKVQMALWADAVNTWSGGLPKWPDASKEAQSQISYIDVTCYDDNDSPVPKWPLTNNPDRFASVQGQPTQLIGGSIPPTAGPQTSGAVLQPPPVMPAGYNGAVNNATGSVPATGSNDGKTLQSVNGEGGTAQIGSNDKGAASRSDASFLVLIASTVLVLTAIC